MKDAASISILIVDDSKVCQDLLYYVLQQELGMHSISFANDGQAALRYLKGQHPDVILMDINMLGWDGFVTRPTLMELYPIPVIIFSSSYVSGDASKLFQALQAGALALLEKPHSMQDKRRIKELCHAIQVAAGIKVINRLPQSSHIATSKSPHSNVQEKSGQKIEALCIGASLGGPIAMEKILSELPEHLSIPVFLSQHIAEGFSNGFAAWLQKSTRLKVKIAQNGELALPHTVYLASDGYDMQINADRTLAVKPWGSTLAKEGITNLFLSVARVYREHSIGVILTGMGKDGAQGLLEMRQMGAETIVQDEKSCIVFGMPKEAIALGAAKFVLPLDRIAGKILSLMAIF